ncbi:MAG: pyrroline-5-carboxylate reductase [Firmicutes bacterium]|nr:pyrroline-5-carboxylate reductase [Bacillota bacterium]
MKKTVGFIGCGNMAQAMLGGMINSNTLDNENVIVSNPTNNKLHLVKKQYDVKVTNDNNEVAKESDILILAVKPNKYDTVLKEIKNHIKENVIIVTIAAGIDINSVENIFDNDIKVIRTMPNTPALVREGMTAMCSNKNVKDKEMKEIITLFKSFGKVEIIDEKLMDYIPGISGSSPAYVYMFIEALADGAVLHGIPREKAYKMAAQAVLGSAKMILETNEHPGKLKDNVCSPSGSTIEAVYTLEKNNFRGTIIAAMESCTTKAIKMNKKN